LTDIFGLGKNMPTIAETEAKKMQKARMDEFKQLLGMPVVSASGGDSLNPLAGLGNPAGKQVSSGLPSVGGTGSALSSPFGRGSGSAQLGTIGNFSSGLASPASGLASPFATPAVVDPPKPRTPPTASFTAPRRAF
jgi:hypothetical protein